MAIKYKIAPFPSNGAMNALFSAACNTTEPRDFSPILSRSLTHVCSYDGDNLVGFVNVAWDGADHAFVLDTCVHPEWRRRRIATSLVKLARDTSKKRGVKWLHVDFEPHLSEFYTACGFRPTKAGLISLIA